MAQRQCTRCKHKTDKRNFKKHKSGQYYNTCSQCLEYDKRRKDAQRAALNEHGTNDQRIKQIKAWQEKITNDLMKRLFADAVASLNQIIQGQRSIQHG